MRFDSLYLINDCKLLVLVYEMKFMRYNLKLVVIGFYSCGCESRDIQTSIIFVDYQCGRLTSSFPSFPVLHHCNDNALLF